MWLSYNINNVFRLVNVKIINSKYKNVYRIGVVLYHTSSTKIVSSELIEYNIPLSLTTAGIMHCLTISTQRCTKSGTEPLMGTGKGKPCWNLSIHWVQFQGRANFVFPVCSHIDNMQATKYGSINHRRDTNVLRAVKCHSMRPASPCVCFAAVGGYVF